MSPRLGHVTVGEAGGEVFLGAALQDLGSIGPETLDIIDSEVERIVAAAEARAEHVLRNDWEAVSETAARLVEFETLSGEALNASLSAAQPVTIDEIPLPARLRGEPRPEREVDE